ncbi:hypothetical protein HAX54_016655, partial [Datura stramonium]|nr:hypothetical protein [Datura stramonium]
ALGDFGVVGYYFRREEREVSEETEVYLTFGRVSSKHGKRDTEGLRLLLVAFDFVWWLGVFRRGSERWMKKKKGEKKREAVVVFDRKGRAEKERERE